MRQLSLPLAYARLRWQGRLTAVRLLSPTVSFPAFWMLGVALSQIHVMGVQRPWSHLMWAVVVVVPVTFALGGLAGSELTARHVGSTGARTERPLAKSTRGSIRRVLVVCVVVGSLEQAHQFWAIRAVPLLSSNIDAARSAQPGGLTIILTDFLTVAAVVALVIPRKLLTRSSLPEIMIAGAAFGAFAFSGGRGVVVLPLLVAFFARTLYWGLPPLRVILPSAAVVLLLVAGFFYVRVNQHPNDTFGQHLHEEVLPQVPSPLRPLVPLDLSIAGNFEALARVVDYFPRGAPYGHGLYDAVAFHRVIPATRSVGSVSAELSPPWVTSTSAGPLWADGGMFTLAIGMIATGFLSGTAYTLARRTRRLPYALLGAYFLYLALFGLYVNLWTQYLDWLFISPLLLMIGFAAEGRAWLPPPLWNTYTALRGPLCFRRRGLRFLSQSQPKEQSKVISDRSDHSRTSLEPQRGRLPDRWRVSARSRIAIAFAALVVAAAAGLTFELVRSPGKPNPPPIPGAPPKEKLALPSAVRATAKTVFFVDQDLSSDNEPIWAATPGASGTRFSEITPTQSGTLTARSRSSPLRILKPGITLRVNRWSLPSGLEALFIIQQRATGVSVLIRDPNRRGFPVIGGGLAPLAPPPRGVRRFFDVATWPRTGTALFVMDLGRRERTLVTAYAVSNFAQPFLRVRAPLRLDPRTWFAAMARVSGTTPDLVLVSRRGASRQPEIHVRTAESNFQASAFDNVLSRRGWVRGVRLSVGTWLGDSTLFAINWRRSTVSVYPTGLMPS